MKNIIMLLSLLSSMLFSSNELKWVDEQIDAIKPSRDGISSSSINALDNPFIFLKKEVKDNGKLTKKSTSSINTNILKVTKKRLVLSAIMNNTALINGKWYKALDKVDKYTIVSIQNMDVILKYKDKELLLTTRVKKQALKFKNN